MPISTCSICRAPNEVRAFVDEQLQKGVRMIDIADAVGIGKSSIHRHSSRCLRRRAVERFKSERRRAYGRARWIVKWPGNRLTVGGCIPFKPEDTIRETDVFIEVVYDSIKPSTVDVAYDAGVVEDRRRFPPLKPHEPVM
jgi:hypothetical protein